jgi:hypothetical protein
MQRPCLCLPVKYFNGALKSVCVLLFDAALLVERALRYEIDFPMPLPVETALNIHVHYHGPIDLIRILIRPYFARPETAC